MTSSYDCNGTGAQNWVISDDQTVVQVAGTNYCLDAGTGKYPNPDGEFLLLTIPLLDPASGTQMKIWTCYSGLAQQTWWYTGDDRISLMNQGTFRPCGGLFSG